MINYQDGEGYIRVKWHKKELGRIYHEENGWVYKPKGCEGRIVSDPFLNLWQLKKYLEGTE